MVMLELEMLYERSTIRFTAPQILADINSRWAYPSASSNGRRHEQRLASEVDAWTGCRIIVANAIANNEAPLVTSDRRIDEEYANAIW